MIRDNKDSGFFSKNNDLRNRILFTILILSVYRLGTYIPLPGIDPESLKELMQSNQKGLMGMFNIFSGGAINRNGYICFRYYAIYLFFYYYFITYWSFGNF